MFSNLPLEQKFDIIIFNPPYVATSKDELLKAQDTKGIEASWAGGEFGIQILLDFVPQALSHLADSGSIYILLISDNLPFLDELDKLNLKWEVILKRSVPGENQFVVKVR